MKKKIIGILVSTLLIATFVIPAVGNINVKNTNMNNFSYDDEIDQEQTIDEMGVPVSSVADMAQSFIPTMEMLTRVEIRLEKTGSPDDITCSLRDDLDSDDLIWVTKTAGEIPPGPSWVEFDFPDIGVIPGNTYYIVCRSDAGVIIDYWEWRSGDSNNNYYPDGTAWWNNWGVWAERDPEHDFCFKTYGEDIEGPKISEITITGIPDTDNPTTNDPSTTTVEMVNCLATIIIPSGYIVLDICWSGDVTPGYGNPYEYTAAPGTHGFKIAICSIIFENETTHETDTNTNAKSFKLFFNKKGDEDDNDKPNWFEYWKIDEAVPKIDQVYYDPTSAGYGYWSGSQNKVYLCQKACDQHYYSAIVLTTYYGTESFGGPTVKGIDCAAEVVAHELYHKWVDDEWEEGGYFHGETDSDIDMPSPGCNDQLPDFYESSTSHTRNDHCDTYDLEHNKHPNYWVYGDQEYMAMRTADAINGIPSNDWANPGKQTNPPYLPSSPAGEYEPVDARFTGSYSDQGVDIDRDGYYDYLLVTAEINVISGGMFNIVAKLNDTTSNMITFDNKPIYLDQGIQAVVLNFDGLTIREHGENGPYTVTFLLDDDFGNEIHYQYDAHTTAGYKYTDFEKKDAIFTGSYSDYGVDIDNDGFYDYLTVEVSINVETTGEYMIEGWLYDNNGDNIVFAKNSEYLNEGSHKMSLNFLGETISRHMEDGPYNLKYLSLTKNENRCDFKYDAYRTYPYSYKQFQPQDITNPPNIPEPPIGQQRGKVGVEYTYEASTTDPDEDDLWYQFNWDDGSYSEWFGPFPSGETVTAEHSWAEKGTYNIRVRARDIFGVMSEWSDPLTVTMPRNKAFNFNLDLLSLLLERFPNVFPILRYILRL